MRIPLTFIRRHTITELPSSTSDETHLKEFQHGIYNILHDACSSRSLLYMSLSLALSLPGSRIWYRLKALQDMVVAVCIQSVSLTLQTDALTLNRFRLSDLFLYTPHIYTYRGRVSGRKIAPSIGAATARVGGVRTPQLLGLDIGPPNFGILTWDPYGTPPWDPDGTPQNFWTPHGTLLDGTPQNFSRKK